MKIGVFADVHDNVDNIRHAVNLFNQHRCHAVLFAGDFVSPLVVPPLRKLSGHLIACLGDNDGNTPGIAGGMRICGTLASGPVGYESPDGVRFVMAHQLDELRNNVDGANVVIYAHTHRANVVEDRHGRWFVNPGETGGWMFRQPSVAIVETQPLSVSIVELPPMPPAVPIDG